MKKILFLFCLTLVLAACSPSTKDAFDLSALQTSGTYAVEYISWSEAASGAYRKTTQEIVFEEGSVVSCTENAYIRFPVYTEQGKYEEEKNETRDCENTFLPAEIVSQVQGLNATEIGRREDVVCYAVLVREIRRILCVTGSNRIAYYAAPNLGGAGFSWQNTEFNLEELPVR